MRCLRTRHHTRTATAAASCTALLRARPALLCTSPESPAPYRRSWPSSNLDSELIANGLDLRCHRFHLRDVLRVSPLECTNHPELTLDSPIPGALVQPPSH